MKIELEVDKHKSVGPVDDMYGHGPVTIIQDEAVEDHSNDEGTTLFVCLDCGYTVDDNRLLAHEECNREDNDINKSWREFLREEQFDVTKLPEASNTDEYPIE